MQNKLIYGVGGLMIGISIGFFVANTINKEAVLRGAQGAANNSGGQVAPGITGPAVDELLQKAEAEPQSFAAQMQTGDMYARIGRFDQAVEFYKRGLILQPENVTANLVLANALFDARRFEEAEGYYLKALSINDKDVNARIDLGATFVERASPDYERAILEFNLAREQDPKNEPAIYYLAIANLRKGDKETASRLLKELENNNPASELIGRLRQNIDPPE